MLDPGQCITDTTRGKMMQYAGSRGLPMPKNLWPVFAVLYWPQNTMLVAADYIKQVAAFHRVFNTVFLGGGGGILSGHMKQVTAIDKWPLRRVWLWACSQKRESPSESRFGSCSASWLGSWFELRAFTSIATAVQITNRICTLRVRKNCADWPMHCFSAHF